YATNVEVLKNFTKQYKNKKVYVANGESLVDALAGVPLAAAGQAPIVLINQQLAEATKDFVKLNMSTQEMVALGGEGVVPSAGLNALTTVSSYATDNAAEGSTDVTKPVEIADNVLITGNNVTLENAKIDYSVYVKGDNVTLSNLNVKGTVFVDPGVNGSATLDGVTAANIVILSGAPHSIKITSSSSGQITISSDGNTNVVLSSVTTNGVSIQTAMVYQTDSAGHQVKTGTITITSGAGNNLGAVTITSDPGKTTEVNLSGTITQPITVVGQGGTSITAAAGTVVANITSNTNNLTLAGAGTYTAVVAQSGTLTAAPGTVLPSVTVAATSATQTITLAGNIGNVIQTQGNVTLAAGATVATMTSTASNATINVPPGASIGSLTGSTGVTVSGGGTVNGQVTSSTTPSAPPAGTTTPGTGGGSSGGSSGGGGGHVTPAPIVLSITSAATGAYIASVSGSIITITPSVSAFKQPNLKLDQNASMNITVNRTGTSYNLGTWNLTNSASGNDLFSVANAPNLDMLQTLEILKATGISSSAIFSAIDFHGILTQAQLMNPTNKAMVYTKMADIFTQAGNTSSTNAFYQALNLPGMYAAADSTTQGQLRAIIDTAVLPLSAGVNASTLLDPKTSATAVATLTSSGKMNTFFNNINFQLLFDDLSASINKGAIFTAIDFTSLYNAISTLPPLNKMAVYLDAASLYQAALTVNTGDNIDYGALLGLVITSPNSVTLTLSNANGTRSYSVIKG
ncbi:MAG: cell wall-binding repeat-containing protein, partial [Desulfitobacteriaceae bacterium]